MYLSKAIQYSPERDTSTKKKLTKYLKSSQRIFLRKLNEMQQGMYMKLNETRKSVHDKHEKLSAKRDSLRKNHKVTFEIRTP